MDEIVTALSNRQRRIILYSLLETDVMDVEDLARSICTTRQDAESKSVDEEAFKSVMTGLHHNHLPHLREAGIVEYDQRSGSVCFRHPPERVLRILELLKEYEYEDE